MSDKIYDPSDLIIQLDSIENSELRFADIWAREKNIPAAESERRKRLIADLRRELNFLIGIAVHIQSNGDDTEVALPWECIRLIELHNSDNFYSTLSNLELMPFPRSKCPLLPAESLNPDWYSDHEIIHATNYVLNDIEDFFNMHACPQDEDFERMQSVLKYFRTFDEQIKLLDSRKCRGNLNAPMSFAMLMVRNNSTSKVFDDLCYLIHKYPDLLLLILGQSPKKDLLTHDKTLLKADLYQRQANMLNLMLYYSCSRLQDTNDELEKEALQKLYGELPDELMWDSDSLILEIEIEKICAGVSNRREAAILKKGLRTIHGKIWKMEGAHKFEDWDRFFELFNERVEDEAIKGRAAKKLLNLVSDLYKSLEITNNMSGDTLEALEINMEHIIYIFLFIRGLLARNLMSLEKFKASQIDKKSKTYLLIHKLLKGLNSLLKFLPTDGLTTLSAFNERFIKKTQVDIAFGSIPGSVKHDLSNFYLHNANLSGLDLSTRNFTDADLSDADLGETELIMAKFCGANLSAANLNKARCESADFSDAIMIQTKAERVDFLHANFNRCDFSGASLLGSGFSDADMQNAIFFKTFLEQAVFKFSRNLPFSISDGLFGDGRFISQNLLNTKDSGRTDFSGLIISHVGIYSEQGFKSLDFSDSRIKFADFSNRPIEGCRFVDSELSHVRFDNSKLTEIYSLGTEFTDCDFTASNLFNSQFKNSYFRFGIFHNANIMGSEFSECSFSNCAGSKLSLTNVIFRDCEFIDSSLFTGLYYDNLIFKNCKFSGEIPHVYKDGVKFIDCDFSGCTLDPVSVYIIDNGENKFFKHCIFEGIRVNDDPTDLPDFIKLGLRDGRFSRDTFFEAISAVHHPKIYFELDISGATVITDQQYLVFLNSNLTGVTYKGSKLKAVSFAEANMQGSIFHNILMQSIIEDSNLRRSEFKYVKFNNSAFYYSDLSLCRFENVIFKDVWFINCDFEGSIFINVENLPEEIASHLDKNGIYRF
ncbi:hypothetical protein GF354_06520 [Candidatus Peregrinibacteria bacterium]|nr:hypothetical protein [Candidatus Peregrinibacteria bacterium]